MANSFNNWPTIAENLHTALSQVVRKTRKESLPFESNIQKMRLDMLPCIAPQYAAKSGSTNSKLFAQTSERIIFIVLMPVSYLLYLGCSQFCKMLSFTSCVTFGPRMLNATPFLMHVNHVVSVCSQKQMIGMDASWIVASMTDEKTFWNESVGQFVRNSMRYIGTRLTVYTTAIKGTIAKCRLSRTCPSPTSVRVALVNLFPEPLFNRLVSMLSFTCTGLGTIKGFALINLCLVSGKRLATNKALTINLHIKTPSLPTDYSIVSKSIQCSGDAIYG